MTLLVILFLSISFSLVATPIFIKYLKSHGIVDKPGGRRMHEGLIPRMGGFVILISLTIIIFSFHPELSDIRGFFYGLLLISLCGIIDDIIGLKWNYKLFFQFLTAVVVINSLNLFSLNIAIFYFHFPAVFSRLLLILFIIGLINSINLMDGLDGLVAGYAVPKLLLLLFLSILYGDFGTNVIIVGALGSILGFLKYNSNPARIFLGDTGSLLIGYLLSYLILSVSLKVNLSDNGYLDLSFAIILLSLPILDTLKVLFIRLTKRTNPFLPDRNHLHHVIFGQIIKQKNVVFIIHIFSLFYIIDAIVYLKYSKPASLLLWVVISISLLYIKKIIKVVQHYSFSRIINKQKSKILTKITVRHKKILIYLTFFPSVFILFSSLTYVKSLDPSILILLILIGISIIVIYFIQKEISPILKIFNIYLNFSVFFVIAFIKSNLKTVFVMDNQLLFYSSISLMLLILLFFIAREEMLEHSILLLTGFDLSIIILTISVFIMDNLLPLANLSFLAPALIYTILFYFWFKILLDSFPKYSHFLYLSSFALPFIALVIAIIS